MFPSRLLLLFLGVILLALAGCTAPTPPAPTATPAGLPPTRDLATLPAVAATPTTSAPAPTATATATPAPLALAIAIAANVPPDLAAAAESALAAAHLTGHSIHLVAAAAEDANLLAMGKAVPPAATLARRVYVVVAPFATVTDGISLAEVQARWRGEGDAPLLAGEDAALALTPLFGEPAAVLPVAGMLDALVAQPDALGVLPFDRLDPLYKVIAVAGHNPLSNRFDAQTYPLTVDLTLAGPEAELLRPLLTGILPPTNRDAGRLTQLIMTGVTAMSRGTAEKMEQKGYVYPALVISDTLAAADITHVSNEAPFIQGCRVNNTYMNLVLCSDYPYWAALEAIGADIVGLSGNHVNDFGRAGARESIAFYRERGIPIYGSGLNTDEACAPLLWEDHGNRFAFIAALAWWPDTAWAAADQPGACYFYDHYDRILADIRRLSAEVDIVAVELQYHETYNPWPIPDQVAEFRDLRAAGADIVTGVQSHVPQALEPGAENVIVYGLGNLFFDQMQSWETRTGLIARHTIYQGRLLSTEILTTVLEDFAQPRWATADERAGILRSIFAAAPPKDALPTPAPPPPPPNQPASQPTHQPTPEPTNQPTNPPTPEPGLSWPAPAAQPQDHYWLARPTAADANQIAAAAYPFGGTAGGRYRVHHGVDIANPTGAPLYAPAAATIVHAGLDQPPYVFGPYPDFFGNTILFRLDQSWQEQPVYVLYGHLNTVDVASGQHVERGQPVGTVGMTGIAIGPHVHVEVRLGGTAYEQSYNSDLWLQPLPGLGTVAGQVVTPDGRAWPEVRLFLYRIEAEGSRLFQIIPTYAADPGLRPDPDWAENFALADVPAGVYDLVVRLGGQILTQRLTVEAGRTAYAQFVVAP